MLVEGHKLSLVVQPFIHARFECEVSSKEKLLNLMRNSACWYLKALPRIDNHVQRPAPIIHDSNADLVELAILS